MGKCELCNSIFAADVVICATCGYSLEKKKLLIQKGYMPINNGKLEFKQIEDDIIAGSTKKQGRLRVDELRKFLRNPENREEIQALLKNMK